MHERSHLSLKEVRSNLIDLHPTVTYLGEWYGDFEIIKVHLKLNNDGHLLLKLCAHQDHTFTE